MLSIRRDPSKPVFDADSAFVHLLLTYVAKESKREMTFLFGCSECLQGPEESKGVCAQLPCLVVCPADLLGSNMQILLNGFFIQSLSTTPGALLK